MTSTRNSTADNSLESGHPYSAHMQQLIQAAKAAGTPYASMLLNEAGDVVVQNVNTVKQQCDPTAHAEMNTIRQAAAKLGRVNLSGCHLITTCEPCPMCAAAAFWSNISKVTFGLSIAGITAAGHRQIPIKADDILRHSKAKAEVEGGLLADEVRKIFP
ncbi:tRNA(Arg) A34 adenosine deaminase TadA [Cyclonatronum proteinivorum]|uniref:tRNA(Arg) A34 adenosine deaminase TadA n=1 Tax=Cyclonatronum proteinivorum TaxID=1457365 RepID=A0A345UK03_9BACT|nr:nucleoside deaminase [Cyclonatronum proteinivorum]AXJ00805.1 tRNA(Arg) A34 adenosine deaminase TadA [Cyclonatronum proteinivorum]